MEKKKTHTHISHQEETIYKVIVNITKNKNKGALVRR